ncbi:MAG: hypothetical protein E3J72_11435 [Planctomycetota bacterium]|nr:MAG: hypothetical protein E3J72_11435 [Planctomycetota bacterium]
MNCIEPDVPSYSPSCPPEPFDPGPLVPPLPPVPLPVPEPPPPPVGVVLILVPELLLPQPAIHSVSETVIRINRQNLRAGRFMVSPSG